MDILTQLIVCCLHQSIEAGPNQGVNLSNSSPIPKTCWGRFCLSKIDGKWLVFDCLHSLKRFCELYRLFPMYTSLSLVAGSHLLADPNQSPIRTYHFCSFQLLICILRFHNC
eukprot:NODE_951_length_2817_cov_0.118102.p3 type:complete len:112 gc:universal NODE_951_length_2817_cov_0.118102:815-480(-)